jgi:hypothetical protein
MARSKESRVKPCNAGSAEMFGLKKRDSLKIEMARFKGIFAVNAAKVSAYQITMA